MYRPAVVFGLYLSFAIAVGAACSNGAPQVPSDDDSFTPPGQSGGSAGTGTMNTGGSFMPTGGAGGSVTTGGTTGGSVSAGGSTGGSVANGGRAAGGTTGGTTGAGGHSTGGSATTGGTGGSTATGGSSSGSAGTGTGAGGSMTGAAGSSSGPTCDAAFAVGMDGFVRMPAKDGSCWHGYAYGAGNSCTSTGCTGMTTIEYCGDATAKGFSMCKGMLSISGTLQSSVSPDYAGFVLIGFSTAEAAGGGTKATVTPTGTGIIVTGTAAGGRVQLQNGSTYYCATFTSGGMIPYTSFNTKCYDSPPDGVAYAKTPIDTIALEIPGGMMDASYSLSLASVAEY